MAEVKQDNRPLSPHISIYRPQLTSMLSIVHRLTGLGLGITAMLVVWWFVAAATSPAQFATADWVLTSYLGNLAMLVSLWALWYHFFNGIRHLRWDAGVGLGLGEAARSGWTVVVLSLLLTALTVYVAI